MMCTVACRLHVAPFVSIGVNLVSLSECKGSRRVGAKSFASAGEADIGQHRVEIRSN
jgi:hypothetical protein